MDIESNMADFKRLLLAFRDWPDRFLSGRTVLGPLHVSPDVPPNNLTICKFGWL